MLSKRDLLKVGGVAAAVGATGAVLGGAAGAARAAPLAARNIVGGVRLGQCSGSYNREIVRSDDQMSYIETLASACGASGGGLMEYHSSQVEPGTLLYARAPAGQPPLPEPTPAEFARLRDERRQWRINTPDSYYAKVRELYERYGSTSFAYSINLTSDMTDPEIESIFRATKALGCAVISTNATKVEMGARLAPFAERHRIDLGFHNHSNFDDPNEVASLESFAKLLAISPRCKANLDVGHFTASNLDAVAFIEKNHDRITHLHMKDRKRDKGRNMPWGLGDAPLKEVLLLIKARRYPIPALVEYEYYGYPGTGGAIEEDRKCLEFMRRTLA